MAVTGALPAEEGLMAAARRAGEARLQGLMRAARRAGDPRAQELVAAAEGDCRSLELVTAAERAGIHDLRLLAAIAATPRELFVPPRSAGQACLDVPIPLAHGQPTSQPSLVAQMIDALRLTGAETVLEIGTGYGYQTALLARLARHVHSIERLPDLAAHARANLAAAGITGAEVLAGDGSAGLPEHAPPTTPSSSPPPPRTSPPPWPSSWRRAAGSSCPSRDRSRTSSPSSPSSADTWRASAS
ncbi:hypothetical protein GCM10020001_006010 [Nonomuraea salmonea]